MRSVESLGQEEVMVSESDCVIIVLQLFIGVMKSEAEEGEDWRPSLLLSEGLVSC